MLLSSSDFCRRRKVWYGVALVGKSDILRQTNKETHECSIPLGGVIHMFPGTYVSPLGLGLGLVLNKKAGLVRHTEHSVILS